MTNRMRAGVVLLVIAQLPGLTACGDDEVVPPTGPGPGPAAAGQPVPPTNRTSISGYVSDTAFRPLAGARIEVVDGPQAGLATVADASGSFTLVGDLDGNTQFRASKDGHVAVTTTPAVSCPPCNPPRYISFSLALVRASVNIAGDYFSDLHSRFRVHGHPERASHANLRCDRHADVISARDVVRSHACQRDVPGTLQEPVDRGRRQLRRIMARRCARPTGRGGTGRAERVPRD